jgi:hypothetical protein
VKFGFIAKHWGTGRRDGCAGHSVSRGVAFGGHDRAVSAAGAMRILPRRFVRASSRATGPMRLGGRSATCFRTVSSGLHRIERLMRLQALIRARPRRRRLPRCG